MSCRSLFVLAIVVAIGLVAFFIGRQRAAAHDGGAVKAAFARALSRLVGFPAAPLCRPCCFSPSGTSARPSISSVTCMPPCRTRTAESVVSSEALAASLVQAASPTACAGSMPRRRGQLPSTFAELQPLLAAKGVALRQRHAGLHDPDRGRGEQRCHGPLSACRRRGCLRTGDRRRALSRFARSARAPAPKQCREADAVGPAWRVDHRHPDDRRHRALDAVPDHQLLRKHPADQFLLRHGVGSALRRRRFGRRGRPVRPDPAARRHALHRPGRASGRGSDRADVGGLHGANMPRRGSARWSSRRWSFWPAFRPSSTASSPS